MPRMLEDVTQNVGLVGYLHNLVCEHPDFRYMPNCLAERHRERDVQHLLDQLNREIVENVQREGLALVNTQVGGRIAIRISICSDITWREEVEATFEAIARLGHLLTKKQLATTYELKQEMESMQC